MQFRILGPIQALLDDEPAALGAPKQRGAARACCSSTGGAWCTAEQLIDGLWGEAPPASAVQSLQVYVHGLRRALGAERIETAGRGYRVVVGEDELDLDRFERTLDRGRAALEAGRPTTRPTTCARRSRSGAGRRSPTCRRRSGARPRPSASRSCGSARSSFATTPSSPAAATTPSSPSSKRLTAEHPYRERFLQQRMLALYRCDRQADALEVYRAAREVLAEDLGLDPSPVLQELERAILRQDPSLAAPEAPTRSTRPLPVPPTPLVGRRLELAAVSALFRDEGARLVTLTGPGGTGKTRLGLAVAHALEPELRDGALFVSLAPVSDPELLVPTIARGARRARGRAEPGRRRDRAPRASAACCSCWTTSSRSSRPRPSSASCSPPPRVSGSWPRAARRCGWRRSTSIRCRRSTLPTPAFRSRRSSRPMRVRLFAARAQAVDPGFELDTGQRTGGRARLPPPRRPAARDRAGCRTRQAARARRDSRAARARAEHAPGRSARRAGTPADARRDDPLELRSARPGGAARLSCASASSSAAARSRPPRESAT